MQHASRQTELQQVRTERLLYTSHVLSTWNSRAFEFGAFLFLATIFPLTLLPASIYALVRAGSAATLSTWLGGYIDNAERLVVIRLSIVGQRAAVALSCAILLAMMRLESLRGSDVWSYTALAMLTGLACVEKLAAIMNTISVERDWVVTIADGNEDHLRAMNARMRRIDLFCKLVAPLFVSFIDAASSQIAVMVTGTMTGLSVLVEYLTIARVYNAVPALQSPKCNAATAVRQNTTSWFTTALSSIVTYLFHPAFLPSFSLALLYLTVLSFNGQMITYLLATGVQSSLIAVLRGVSAIFELSATWIAPWVMRRIGPVRSGIWFINWQIFCMCVASLFLWFDFNATLATIGTVAAVIASRVGLWGFDLSAQIIVQEEVEPELRGIFSSQEFAFQNIFEMLSFASTIVFARPAEFKIPATISAAAVGVAGILYAAFVRARRGHLVHLSRCVEWQRKGWRPVPQDEDGGDELELADRSER